ncbi:hypothetical protein ACRRTK_021075 [Alexandromys fortis]
MKSTAGFTGCMQQDMQTPLKAVNIEYFRTEISSSSRLASSQLPGDRRPRPFTSPSPAPDRPIASALPGPLLPALRSLPRALTRDSEPGGLASGRGTAAAGRPRSLRSPLSRSGGHGGGSPARRPPGRAGTSRCRSRWAERTHTHTQTGRARASGDRAGRAGGAQLLPPPPLLLLVPPLVLMLRALRQEGQFRDIQQRPHRVHNLLSTSKLPLATSLFSGFRLQVVSCGELLSFPLPKFHSSSPV